LFNPGVHSASGERRGRTEVDTKGTTFSDLFCNILFLYMKIKLVDMQEQARRQQRKNRDEFRKMLEEHVANGTITARTWWRDYCAQVHGIFSVTNK
jgi:hypothetical protein